MARPLDFQGRRPYVCAALRDVPGTRSSLIIWFPHRSVLRVFISVQYGNCNGPTGTFLEWCGRAGGRAPLARHAAGSARQVWVIESARMHATQRRSRGGRRLVRLKRRRSLSKYTRRLGVFWRTLYLSSNRGVSENFRFNK